MRVAVDVDGVLAERVDPILDIVHEEYGVRLEKRDVDEWDIRIPGTDTMLSSVIHESIKDPNHILDLSPIEGAVEAMEELNRRHEVWIATHRPAQSHDTTIRWLKKNGIEYDHFVENCGDGKCDIEADVLIDDRPYNVERFAQTRGESILFRQPWNSKLSSSQNVKVVKNWEDVLSVL